MNRTRVMSNYVFYHRNLSSSCEVSSRIRSVKNTHIRTVREMTKKCTACTNVSEKNSHVSIESSTRANFIQNGIHLNTGNSVLFSRRNISNFSSRRHFSSEASMIIETVPSFELYGFWKTLSESVVVEYTQNSLVWLHTTTGLPWWATIVIATCTVRTVFTFPLAIYQAAAVARLYNLKYEMEDIAHELREKIKHGIIKLKWTESYAQFVFRREYKKKRQELIERDNCHPMKTGVLVLIQLPVWLTLSAALRNMCFMLPERTEAAQEVYLELVSGGFGWMQNLTLPDHLWIVPITLGLLNLTIIQMQVAMRISEPTRAVRIMTNLFRCLSLLMVPLSAFVPSSMSLYWASSSAFGIVQNLILMSPRFRRLTRIPETDCEHDQPYQNILDSVRSSFGQNSSLKSENNVVKASNVKPR